MDKLWGILGKLGVFGEMRRGVSNRVECREWYTDGEASAIRSHAMTLNGNACLGVARHRLKTYG